MHIAVIEDSDSDRKILRHYIEKYYCGDLSLYKEYQSGEEFLDAYTPGSYDVIFIDSYMGVVTGMDVARSIRAAGDKCALYFTTSSHDFAVEGYKVKLSGYLIKPFTYENFSETVKQDPPKKEQAHIVLSGNGTITRLMVKHIIWCESQGHYVIIHTAGEGDLSFRLSFTELTGLLSPYDQFIVCFRGCIVNLEYVKELTGVDFILYNGQRVPIRQREVSLIMRLYADWQFKRARESCK